MKTTEIKTNRAILVTQAAKAAVEALSTSTDRFADAMKSWKQEANRHALIQARRTMIEDSGMPNPKPGCKELRSLFMEVRQEMVKGLPEDLREYGNAATSAALGVFFSNHAGRGAGGYFIATGTVVNRDKGRQATAAMIAAKREGKSRKEIVAAGREAMRDDRPKKKAPPKSGGTQATDLRLNIRLVEEDRVLIVSALLAYAKQASSDIKHDCDMMIKYLREADLT